MLNFVCDLVAVHIKLCLKTRFNFKKKLFTLYLTAIFFFFENMSFLIDLNQCVLVFVRLEIMDRAAT